MYNTISFPGLGIGEITINPNITSIGNLSIKWYAVLICIGILVAFFYCQHKCDYFKISKDDFLDILLFALPIGFVGARIAYVLGDIESFNSFYDVIAVWNGGLAIYGGVIAAAITVICVCKFKKINFLSVLDLMGIGLLIGQIIGRLGNFFNVEVYGIETTLPWRMGVGYNGISEYVHPLFMYEILWNIIGLVLILGYLDLRKFKGEVFLWYVAWYGLGRGMLEPLRDTQYNLHLFGVRINMVLAFASCAAAIILIIVFRLRSKSFITAKKVVDVNYEPQFESLMDKPEENDENNDVILETEKENENGSDN